MAATVLRHDALSLSIPAKRATFPFPASWNKTKPTLTRWERFREFIHIESATYANLETYTKQKEISELTQRIFCTTREAIKSNDYCFLRRNLHTLLSRTSEEQLKQILGLIAKGQEQEEAVMKLLDLIPLEQLVSFSKEAGDAPLEMLIDRESQEAKILARFINTPATIAKRNRIIAFLGGVIDTVLASFSFFEIGREPSSSWEASQILALYAKIFTIPALIFGALTTVVSISTALLVTAAAVAILVGGLFLYIKCRKKPEELIYCENLTQQARLGQIAPVLERDTEIAELLSLLQASRKGSRSHPLLVGKTQVGKSEIIKGLAQWIAQGHEMVPKEFRNKTVFVVHTTKMITDAYSPENLTRVQRLLKRLGKHKDEVIVVWEELQAATQANKLADELLGILDSSTGSLPYCIGTITEEHYKDLGNDRGALAARFQKIDVQALNKKQTLTVLKTMARLEAPEIKDINFEKLYDTSGGERQVQPQAAKRLLAQEIAREKSLLESPKGKEIRDNELEINRLSHQLLLHSETDIKTRNELLDQIARLEKEKQELQAAEQRIKEKLEESEQKRNKLKLERESLRELSCRIKLLPRKEAEPLKKLFLFKRLFKLPAT